MIAHTNAENLPESTFLKPQIGIVRHFTCLPRGRFNQSHYIYETKTIEVSTVKIPIDSLVVKDIILGVGTGLVVTYMNGNKTIKAKVPYCANIGGPTVTGNVGTYSTKNTGNTKISFSADAYYNGSVTFQVTESLLEQAQLEIKFKIVDNLADCNKNVSISNKSLTEIKQLSIFTNTSNSSLEIKYNSDKNSNYSIQIIDILGNTIATKNTESVIGNNELKMNLPTISRGVYFLQISNGINFSSKKFAITE